jgi:signal transduction histidine kinase
MTPINPDIPRTTSLRRVFWLSFLPLSFVFLGSFGVILVQTSRVHEDIRRIATESTEVGLARKLSDEVRGISAWVEQAETITLEAADLVTADARQHLDTAEKVTHEFESSFQNEPTSPKHAAERSKIIQTIQVELTELRKLLGARGAALRAAGPHVQAAFQAAETLENRIHQDSQALCAGLDQRSEEIVRLIVLLCIVAGITLFAAGSMFRRRVLLPVANLDAAARRIGDGEFDTQIEVRSHDELGTLAVTMQDMAGRIRAHQEDLEQRVAQRSRELLRTARLADLGTLAAGVAHEINNPLAAIATCADGLLRDRKNGHATSDERMSQYLEIIGKEAMRARDTTQRLLAFARPESGRREPVWIARECREVATMLDHSAAKQGVLLNLDNINYDLVVLGDGSDLRQVLFNLIKNALDESPVGGRIDVAMHLAEDQVHVTVSDQGKGIDPSLGDRIFEPFVTTKEPGQGTGLGLAISHRIVTDHGGSLRAENREGSGARFVLSLPKFRES